MNLDSVFPKAGPHEIRILGALRRIIRSAELYSRDLAQRFEVTTPQLVCLKHIVNENGLCSRTLSQRVSLSPSTLVGIIDRLENKGLVERRRSSSDRRIWELHATDAGISLSREAPIPLQDRLVRNLGLLSPDERDRTAAVLELIVEMMDVEKVAAEPLIDAGSNIRLISDVEKENGRDNGRPRKTRRPARKKEPSAAPTPSVQRGQ